MPNTTNFNFPTPADSDLVKDGASAIRSLGNSIDTAFVDLKGGTTGQVLAKNSNTDLDFTWSADAGIPATIVDAKGDIIAATAADTVSRLAVGANNTVLTADSSTATGLKWATAGSSLTISQIASGSFPSSSSLSLTGLTQDYLLLHIRAFTWGTANGSVNITFNNNTNSVYDVLTQRLRDCDTWSGEGLPKFELAPESMLRTDVGKDYWIEIKNCKNAGFHNWSFLGNYPNTGGLKLSVAGRGIFLNATALTSIEIKQSDGYTFNGGSYWLWGA